MINPPPLAPDAVEHSLQIAGAFQLHKLNPNHVSWLWPGRIPIGRLTLLVGNPGLGKSLVTLDLAARVSLGAAWPDQKHSADAAEQGETLAPTPRATPGSVLLLTAEDNLADTVLPRLVAAGADCSRIVAIPSIVSPYGTGNTPADFILRRELARINQLLNHLPDCRLLVVDPVTAYLTGSANSSGEVRRLFAPLAQLAHERKLAVLAVSHLRKRNGDAIHRTLGSQVFVSAARAVWVVTRDPADHSRRLMVPIKNNLADDRAGLAYSVEVLAGNQPVIRWATEPTIVDADSALRGPVGHPRTERDDAIEWLREKLASGPLPARQIREEAEAHAIRLVTLRRAFRELKGEAIRIGFGDFGGWSWRLPGNNAKSRRQFETVRHNGRAKLQLRLLGFCPLRK